MPRSLKLLILCATALLITTLSARIVIYGDTRTGDDIHARIAQKIGAENPGIVFHTGDLVSKGEQQHEYDRFHQISQPIYDKAQFFPAKGNHERSSDLFLANFPQLKGKKCLVEKDSPASTYYCVKHDSINFIILDTTQKISPGSDQYKWLEAVLDQAPTQPTIIIQHHPIFSSGKHGDELGLSFFQPALLARYNVLAVFAGHDHCYERSLYKGISYVTTGGGGAPLYDQNSRNDHSKIFLKTHHYCILERTGKEIKVQVIALESDPIDSFTLSW